MRLVLLAGADIAIAAGVRRGRPDAATQPFGGLVAGVAPVLVVVGNGPATIQVPPHRRVGVGERLGADFRNERRAEPSQVPPVAVGPAVAAMQVLVARARERRT